jgi:hypothetical protein
MNRMTKIMKRILAILAAPAAMPPNPESEEKRGPQNQTGEQP